MSDLKPCPFCGGAAMRSCIPGTAKCLECGASTIVNNWNTRPAPELPEGFMDREGVLYVIDSPFLQHFRLAWFEGDGTLYLDRQFCPRSQAQALAIWLQRRSK